MARRTFDVIDVTEILMHWHAGRSKNEMAESLGVDRKTLRKYIAPAEAAGIVPGGPAKTEEEWAELVRGWFPELADTRLRQVTWPAIERAPRLHHRAAEGRGADVDDPSAAARRARPGASAWRASAGMWRRTCRRRPAGRR